MLGFKSIKFLTKNRINFFVAKDQKIEAKQGFFRKTKAEEKFEAKFRTEPKTSNVSVSQK